MTKVYIAASYTGRRRAREAAARLRLRGFDVLGDWFDDDNFVEKAWDHRFDGAVSKVMARVDAYNVMDADIVVVDSIDRSSTGGSDTELGIALALSLQKKVRVFLVGPTTNVFHTLVEFRYESWDEVLDSLSNQ